MLTNYWEALWTGTLEGARGNFIMSTKNRIFTFFFFKTSVAIYAFLGQNFELFLDVTSGVIFQKYLFLMYLDQNLTISSQYVYSKFTHAVFIRSIRAPSCSIWRKTVYFCWWKLLWYRRVGTDWATVLQIDKHGISGGVQQKNWDKRKQEPGVLATMGVDWNSKSIFPGNW